MKKDTIRALLIVAGVLILLAILGLGSAVWLFMRSFEVGKADAASAAQRFEEVKSRFGGVAPLLELRDGEPVVTRRPPAAAGHGGRLATMHIVAWDSADEDFAHIELPFWLLRLKSGPIEIASGEFSSGDLGITVEELERYGPTLVLDHDRTGGSRVVVWTE